MLEFIESKSCRLKRFEGNDKVAVGGCYNVIEDLGFGLLIYMMVIGR